MVKKNSNKTDLVLITRQIATLVNASMPLDEVLDIVGKQNSKSKMIEIIQRIRVNIQEGHSFADALSPFPAVFSPLYKTMVTAGEVSGHLGLVLVRLADHIEQTQKYKENHSGTYLPLCVGFNITKCHYHIIDSGCTEHSRAVFFFRDGVTIINKSIDDTQL